MPDYSNYRYNNCHYIKAGDVVTVNGDFNHNENINPDSYGILLPNTLPPMTGNIECFIDWKIEPEFSSNLRNNSCNSEQHEAELDERRVFTIFNLEYAWGAVPWERAKKGFERYAQ